MSPEMRRDGSEPARGPPLKDGAKRLASQWDRAGAAARGRPGASPCNENSPRAAWRGGGCGGSSPGAVCGLGLRGRLRDVGDAAADRGVVDEEVAAAACLQEAAQAVAARLDHGAAGRV